MSITGGKMDKKTKQILTIAICLFVAVAGIFLQYRSYQENKDNSIFEFFKEESIEQNGNEGTW